MLCSQAKCHVSTVSPISLVCRYLVDVRWMKAWKKYTGYDQLGQSSAKQTGFHPGFLHTSDLLAGETPIVMVVALCSLDLVIYLPDIEKEKLKEQLMEELDYSLVPEAGWEKLVEWYGMAPGSIPIARKVVEYGLYLKQHLKVEVYRLEFKLGVYPKLTEHIIQEFSRGDTVGECPVSLHFCQCML